MPPAVSSSSLSFLIDMEPRSIVLRLCQRETARSSNRDPEVRPFAHDATAPACVDWPIQICQGGASGKLHQKRYFAAGPPPARCEEARPPKRPGLFHPRSGSVDDDRPLHPLVDLADVVVRAGLGAPVLEGPGWAEAMQGYLGRGFGPYDSPDLKARVMEEIGRGPGRLAAPLMRYVLSSDHASLIASSDCPLLYLHARVRTDLARLRELRPDALIAAVAGSGHWMMLEVRDQVNAMLDRFLDIVARSSSRVRV